MPKTKPDQFAAMCLADADHYTVCRFLGRGRYDTKRFPSADEAKAEALGDPRAMIMVVSRAGFTANVNGLV